MTAIIIIITDNKACVHALGRNYTVSNSIMPDHCSFYWA